MKQDQQANQNEGAVKMQHTASAPFAIGDTAPVAYCNAADGHCITCSDEAVSVQVVRLDATRGLAVVIREDEPDIEEEIDITLLEMVAPGDMVLAHGGVALARMGVAGDE